MDYTDKNVGATIAVASISPRRLMDQVRDRLRLQKRGQRTLAFQTNMFSDPEV